MLPARAFQQGPGSPESVCWRECRLVCSRVALALARPRLPITDIKEEAWCQNQRISTSKLIPALCELGKLLLEQFLSQDFSPWALLTFWTRFFFFFF